MLADDDDDDDDDVTEFGPTFELVGLESRLTSSHTDFSPLDEVAAGKARFWSCLLMVVVFLEAAADPALVHEGFSLLCPPGSLF